MDFIILFFFFYLVPLYAFNCLVDFDLGSFQHFLIRYATLLLRLRSFLFLLIDGALLMLMNRTAMHCIQPSIEQKRMERLMVKGSLLGQSLTKGLRLLGSIRGHRPVKSKMCKHAYG